MDTIKIERKSQSSRRWRYEMRIKKHPQTIAWDKWIESPEGKACSQDLPTAHIYLLNRLVRAFDAGVSWAEKKRGVR